MTATPLLSVPDAAARWGVTRMQAWRIADEHDLGSRVGRVRAIPAAVVDAILGAREVARLAKEIH